MQIRVHGIGGPTAASVLGMSDDAGTDALWQTDEHNGYWVDPRLEEQP